MVGIHRYICKCVPSSCFGVDIIVFDPHSTTQLAREAI